MRECFLQKKMKKSILAALFTAIIAAAGWNISQSEKGAKLSDVALANVEALTGGETGPGTGQPEDDKWSSLRVDCFGNGGHVKGKRIICFHPGFSSSCIETSCN